MAIRVKVVQVGKDFKNVFTERILEIAEKHTGIMAEETKSVIQRNITEGLVRPDSSGNLSNSFQVEKTNDGHGVGNISFLNEVAKYWRHINYGSEAIGANWQHQVPEGEFSPGNPEPNGQDFRQGRWRLGGKHSFFVTKPIIGINYIEKTLAEIPSIISKVLKTFLG